MISSATSSPFAQIDKANQNLGQSLQRLGSGSRINSARDDAASLAIATQMAAQLGGGQQAQRNIQDGLSVTETAGGALNQVSDTLQRMRELAVQAANATNSPSDRQALQAEFAQLGQNLDQIAGQTRFNGQSLLDGSFNTSLQVGPAAGDSKALALGNASQEGLGIVGQDVLSQGGANTALQAIDQALSRVSGEQSQVGATQSALSSAAANLASTYENLAAARSRVADADYGAESGGHAQTAVRQQAAQKALALYNANQGTVLNLLPSQKP